MVKKILTHKSGKFVFSGKYSHEKLSDLLVEAKVLYRIVSDLPILPDIAAQIQEEIVRRSIFGTAALEGNPLTEERVAQIISESNSVKEMARAEKEIANLKLAYNRVAKLSAPDSVFELTEKAVKQIHAEITHEIESKYNVPGNYRNHVAKVGDAEHGGVYTPPKCLADIRILMKEYIAWINSKEIAQIDPALRAGLAHYYFGLIHPFGDGNGRTARLIEALLMQATGIKYVPVMLSNFYHRNIDDYFWAFSKCIKNKENDMTTFLEFVLKGVIDALNIIKDRITLFIRKFTLREYYAVLKSSKQITERQHNFLVMLLELEYGKPFTLEDLFNVFPLKILYEKISERTARRDLKKLSKLDLLVLENNKYDLNFFVLG